MFIELAILIGFIIYNSSSFWIFHMPSISIDGILHYICIATAVQNAICPDNSNPFDLVTFHINSFKNFNSGYLSIFIKVFAIVTALFPMILVAVKFQSPKLQLSKKILFG
jgi:hypothetical protein